MTNLAKSFATLVKYNNGFFKSEKQADFLLSQCDNLHFSNSYMVTGKVYNNDFNLIYICDNTGIIEVKQYSVKKNTYKTNWVRKSDSEFKAQQKKHFMFKVYKKAETKLYAMDCAIQEQIQTMIDNTPAGELSGIMPSLIELGDHKEKVSAAYDSVRLKIEKLY